MKYKLSILSLSVLIFSLFTWLAFPLPQEEIHPKWTFYDANGETLFTENIVITKSSDIPTQLKTILINTEDQRFYDHWGVDPKALTRAFYQNITKQDIISGASTITMQLARLKYLQGDKRNLWYKAKQILYAFKLEWHLTKEEILNQYLQRVYLGNGSYGISQGSERYFSKSPDQLSLGEKALLVGIMPNPAKFNPLTNPQKAHARKNLVLDRLKDNKIIDQKNYSYWRHKTTKTNPKVSKTIIAPHFIFWLKDRLPTFKGHKEIHVHTTLEKNLYQDLLHIAHQEITEKFQEKNLHSSSIIVLDNDSGSIKSMIGSINFFDQKRDGAVNMAAASRQSGSVLKPFLYALALQKGWSPLSELIDEPLGYKSKEGQYNPRNFYADQFYGRVRMREALVNSYNLSAVYLLSKVSLKAFDQILQNLNLNLNITEQQLGLSVILGSGEVNLLDLTNAYRTFPRHGQWTPYQFITRIEDENAFLLHTPLTSPGKQIFKSSTADWITHALSDEPARWKLFGQNNILEIDRPAASKTGTSQEFKDNWVVGYTPQYTVGVWVGNPDGSPLHTTSGIEGAGPIWNKVMRRVHQNIPETTFKYQSERKPTPICRRPYLSFPNCSEHFLDLLTDKESQDFTPSLRPTLRMSFPQHGDAFHPKTKLLLQVINNRSDEVTFFLDNKKTDAFIPTLSKGPHTIYAQSGGEQSETITIHIE